MAGYPLSSRKADAWQYKSVPSLIGGINSGVRADELRDNQCVTLMNVLMRQGSLWSDTGYKPFAQPIQGLVQLEYKWVRNNGTIVTVLVTTKTVYTYDSSSATYKLVKGTASTTITVGTGPGSTTFTGASGTGFSNGDLIGIDLANGAQHQSTVSVALVSGSWIFTLDTPVPANTNISVGAIVVRAVVLTGDADHQVSAVTVASNDWMVFTNNINVVKRYNGTDCVDVPNLPSAGNVVCKAVAVFNAALFLLNTIEGGTNFPQRARRSDQGDPTNWTTGTSGKDDLLDSSDGIVTAKILGAYLIVYRDRSVVRGYFIGAGGINYQFDTMATGDGAVSVNAVADIGDYHIFIGQADVYAYHGTFELKSLGDAVYFRLFSSHGNLNPLSKNRIFTFFVFELNEVLIFYPATNSTACNRVLRFNVDKKTWYDRQFADNFLGGGSYQFTNAFSWTGLIGNWTAQTWPWDSQVLLSNSIALHLGSASQGQVFEYDYLSALDNATPIAYTVETKDFIEPDSNIRFDMFEAYMQGTNILIQYSIDEGRSWLPLGNGAIDATITQVPIARIRKFLQFLCSRVRFRFTGSSPDFRLDWFGFSYKIESIF